MTRHEKFIEIAFEEAFKAMRKNLGGPFGAVIVKNGKIIAKDCNHILSDTDPTAHAEIMAIRSACKSINSFDLSGCTIYSTCEPCPMCLSAIYWANISTVYFVMTRNDAKVMGFKDEHIYEEFNLPPGERQILFIHTDHPGSEALLEEWGQKPDKLPY
jgi:guanine deaminase